MLKKSSMQTTIKISIAYITYTMYSIKTLLFVCLLLFASCHNKTLQKESLIINLLQLPSLERIETIPETIDLSNAKIITNNDIDKMVNTVEYIQLDSQEPIGKIDKMIITGDKIYIMDSNWAQQIFVFNKNGKLLFQIKRMGGGPKEYISLWDMQVDTIKNEVFINDAAGLAYIYYSTKDGSFIRKEKAIQNCAAIRLGDKYLNILTNGQSFSSEDWQIIVSDKDSAIYKGFRMQPIQKNDWCNNTFQYDSENNVWFTPSFSDTLYQITTDFKYYPLYVIKQNKSTWKKNNEPLSVSDRNTLIRENGYTEFKGNFLSAGEYISFFTLCGYQNSIINLPYFWNNKTKELYKWDILNNNRNPANLFPVPTCSDGTYFYGTFNTYGKKFPGDKLNPHLKDLLDKQTEDSNPIVVKYAFR